MQAFHPVQMAIPTTETLEYDITKAQVPALYTRA
jgi:hypothetical protein